MDVLDALRDGGRVVGVVSHVAELRDRIPTQLVVAKGRSGSTISLHGVTHAPQRRTCNWPGPRLGLDIDSGPGARRRSPPPSASRRAARLAAAAASSQAALVGLVHVPAAHAAAPEWKRERGIVIECVGDAHGVQVWTSVYENQRYGNTVQVVIGGPDDGNGSSRSTDDEFLLDGSVKASVQVNGKKAVIHGTAVRYGARSSVYEEFDDAGFLIKTRGFHRQLRTDLVATYAGKVVR